MKTQANSSSRPTILLCVSVVLSVIAPTAGAQNNSQITVEVGQPNIWSLGQAHYLLAAMRENSRGLGVKVPLPSDLDPYSANGARLNVLRTLFGAEADFNGVAGAQNDMLRKKFDTEFGRFSAAQNRIDAIVGPYAEAVSEVSDLTVQIAALPDNPANADRKKQLNAHLARRTAERDALKAELDELRKISSPTPGSLVPAPTAATGSITPQPDDLKSVFDAIVKGSSTPRLDASTTLDNYVQMQYEVIAKQLTLLRDEIGPDQRLVFLELPMSLYSVPKRDDEYVVRLEWSVTRFFGPTGGVADKYRDEGEGEENQENEASKNQSRPITLDLLNERTVIHDPRFRAENLALSRELETKDWVGAEPNKFRVIDIIPRQSALNVNDVHGTQKGLALTAKFLSVFGLGGQVSYQRQRAMYEQFLQQEVYASAFGKGMSNFGWTFGPLPGTKRLAPGVRTTYAILAIPREALAIELHVAAKVHKRDRPPTDSAVKEVMQANEGLGAGTFRLLIPNERTEGFWVDSVAYIPVEKGKQATMIINGKYFSPLTGVLVNGVPLKRAVSIAKNESLTTSLPSAIDAAGEYEYLNPQQLILSFKMDANYVGTPLITLVTPEKTSAINRFKLDEINFYFKKKSLAEVSEDEPMFTDSFQLAGTEVVDDSDAQYVTVFLRGRGLHRGARFFIGPRALDRAHGEEATFLSSLIYRLKFRRPTEGRPVTITYRNSTRQSAQEASVSFQQNVVSDYEILRYDSVGHTTVLEVLLSVSGQDVGPRVDIDPRDGELVGGPVGLGNHKFRLRIVARRDPVPLSVTAVSGVTRIFDIGLPVSPSIDSVINASTGKPEGPAAKGGVVTLRGKNFPHVVRVFFGGKEATIQQLDPQVILVNAPAGDEGAVQILLETNVNLRGRVVSNIADFRTQGKAMYSYTK